MRKTLIFLIIAILGGSIAGLAARGSLNGFGLPPSSTKVSDKPFRFPMDDDTIRPPTPRPPRPDPVITSRGRAECSLKPGDFIGRVIATDPLFVDILDLGPLGGSSVAEALGSPRPKDFHTSVLAEIPWKNGNDFHYGQIIQGNIVRDICISGNRPVHDELTNPEWNICLITEKLSVLSTPDFCNSESNTPEEVFRARSAPIVLGYFPAKGRRFILRKDGSVWFQDAGTISVSTLNLPLEEMNGFLSDARKIDISSLPKGFTIGSQDGFYLKGDADDGRVVTLQGALSADVSNLLRRIRNIEPQISYRLFAKHQTPMPIIDFPGISKVIGVYKVNNSSLDQATIDNILATNTQRLDVISGKRVAFRQLYVRDGDLLYAVQIYEQPNGVRSAMLQPINTLGGKGRSVKWRHPTITIASIPEEGIRMSQQELEQSGVIVRSQTEQSGVVYEENNLMYSLSYGMEP